MPPISKSTSNPLPENSETTIRKGFKLSQPRSRVQQVMKKFAKGIKKKFSKPSKGSRNCIPASQNIDPRGAPSGQKVEDNNHLTTPEIPSDSVSQGLSGEPSSQVRAAPSGGEEGPDHQLAVAELQSARDGIKSVGLLGRHATPMASAGVNAPADLDAMDNFETTYLQPLKIVDAVLEKIANVHPYAKMALGVLSAASKIIIAQTGRDKSILSLLEKLADVYNFINREDNFGKIESMRGIVGKVAQQTIECARFIREYSETKSFWKRVGKNVVAETDNIITQYNKALDELMQQFRDETVRDVAIFVHSAGKYSDAPLILTALIPLKCLPGTRTGILSEIIEWINSSGDSVPRVMWLSGPAGTGKSAIAHTIANWFKETGGPGSCFCFDRQEEADRRHEKIFSTIARDLADRDPGMKRALADAVKGDISLKNTPDIIQQWRKLLMEPLNKLSASSAGSVLIVIEALDESGGVETRSNLLRILAGRLQDNGLPKIKELPSNFRILVTSRPHPDIEKGFEGADHIIRLSMDSIPAKVAEGDIRAFVSEELKGLSGFQGNHFATLAKNADGLFEWARLACGYIKLPFLGSSSMKCFKEVVKRRSEGREDLLYNMYRLILTDLMPKDNDTHYKEAVAAFRSVMGQILATSEPLPLDSLNAMRRHFPESEDHDHYEVDEVIKHMGPLLSGTTDSSIPIRPLHATFQEFLTDKSSSGDFFVEKTQAQQRDLAFASLRIPGCKNESKNASFHICHIPLDSGRHTYEAQRLTRSSRMK
ncbi:hypothetical protein CY34DRAFT_19067 [Suillus luteus UH-Slu-Lm8-n1]|uniref:NACHT domain-containing protein n=1 Tax=Suillus luteus UH-Slu-Lm8-n1 TaxID=930992 RepID=A0A0D0A2M6_9AGAM|nr:hypothetical protein CY34DRAFT_19067 [Suillus luteus UH-Slu-Lm8-n1]